LADAWHDTRPSDKILLIDLPSGINKFCLDFVSKEYERLAHELFKWKRTPLSEKKIEQAVETWNTLSHTVEKIELKMAENYYPGMASELQTIVNTAASDSTQSALSMAEALLRNSMTEKKGNIPVFVFGNLLFDPKVYKLFEDWNIHVAGTDFCTSSRFITGIDYTSGSDVFKSLAASYLNQTPCARTMDTDAPGSIGKRIARLAKKANAKGVIGFTLKFCDPYLARIPMIREDLKEANIPFLMLEGDCTMGSIGQQQTRIEAFTEMLGV
jgi:benzoyl-CoA reductase/2-hydroxyglutaryl-CoA dehydratase subunit BcrC/BadD/HgdB